jgi:hypothetical protein
VDEDKMQFSLHCLQKDTPFSLNGGLVSWLLGRLTMTIFFSFPLDQRVVTFHFGFSTSTSNLSGVCFLVPSSGLGDSSDVEVAAIELFFLNPAILDFTVSLL